MNTSLEIHQRRLILHLRTLDKGFDRHLRGASTQRCLDRVTLREGFISSLWQAWSRFMRYALLSSALGGITRSGKLITSDYSGLSAPEIAYVAAQLARGKPIGNIKPLGGLHLEPTWGDITKALLIAEGLNTSHTNQSLSALSLAALIPDLQACRNATAHINQYQFVELNKRRVKYADTSLMHPTDVCLWIDPLTHANLWKSWIDEMQTIASSLCA